jgi:hypothetical protein
MTNMYLDKSDLMAAGWTTAAIKTFLPPPRVMCGQRYRGDCVAHSWAAATVMVALHLSEARMYFRRLAETKAVQPVAPAMHTQQNLEVAAETSVYEVWESRALAAIKINILDATREASRAAHRYRDAAAQNFERGYVSAATRNSRAKRDFYAAKERGILALHRVGAIRYAGASAQGMAVYEYGAGGRQCLHSALHPTDMERVPVPDHPRILFVAAKKEGIKETLVLRRLLMLDADETGYERSSTPTRSRERKCFICGESGYLPHECRAA